MELVVQGQAVAGSGKMAPEGQEVSLAEPCFLAKPRWDTAYSRRSPSARPPLTPEPDTLAGRQDTASFFLGMKLLLVNFSFFTSQELQKHPLL